MKRIWMLLLCMCLAFSLFACKDSDSNAETNQPDTTTATQPQATEPTQTEGTQPTQPEATEPTQPAEPVKKVDIQKLNSLEQADTFGLKVIKKEKVENGFKQGAVVNPAGDDALVLTVKNETGVKIVSFQILVLATDQDGAACDLGSLSGFYFDADYPFAPQTKMLGISYEIENGAVFDNGAIQCDLEKVENVNLVVYSYTDANGNEVFNPAWTEWLINTAEVELP